MRLAQLQGGNEPPKVRNLGVVGAVRISQTSAKGQQHSFSCRTPRVVRGKSDGVERVTPKVDGATRHGFLADEDAQPVGDGSSVMWDSINLAGDSADIYPPRPSLRPEGHEKGVLT